jgi:flagellar basal-body rod modification protein FlgD
MSITTVAQQQAAAVAAANLAASGISSSSNSGAGAASTAAAGATSSAANGNSASNAANALQSLSGNFTDFLSLLTTQLQNQDPTNPMDTNQFTSQLVQMANVEQQIATNGDLTSLIQLTQGNEILQSSSIVGKSVVVQSNEIPLQNGTGTVQFNATTAEPVAIAIYNATGTQVLDATVQAQAGQNSWTWNGQNAYGGTEPDGAYKIAVIGANADGTTTALPFNVVGTATSVQQGANNSGLQLDMGALSVGFSAVQSVEN